jgi:membrane glycosyltransferase
MPDYTRNAGWLGAAFPAPAMWLRRTVFFLLVLATSACGIVMMHGILHPTGFTPVGAVILVLFAATFTWIALSFWSAVIGFLLRLLDRDPLSLQRSPLRGNPRAPLLGRTALVMPVHNEEPQRVMAGLEAMYRDLIATGEAGHFHLYLLSDTTDADIAVQEEAAWDALRLRLDAGNGLFYRRRASNEGRKAGNIAEFCRRWGKRYEHMVVLDADSVMTGRSLVQLVRIMQANPRAGILQTVPIPVRQQTAFGRAIQFAAALYCPMLAAGASFWQGATANYWGHNAILRMRPFMQHCELPVLSGKPPLGGEILSHDFVEAALMRRGGYHVYLLTDIEGSYEEVPGNLFDYAKRDRRWTQGNLQHLRLLGVPGLHALSRLHFLLGAFAFISSLLWLLMLAASTGDALFRALTPHAFFASGKQLFPHWPIIRTDLIWTLLWMVVGMLFLPKIMGVVTCLARPARRQAFGGTARLLASAFWELVFQVLIAPILMVYHAWFVTAIILGRAVNWGPQDRNGRSVPWPEAVRNTWPHTLGAAAWGTGTALVAPVFFLALSPVLAGLLLAAPLVSWSSREAFGAWLQEKGLLLVPSETDPPRVLLRLHHLLETPHRYREMPAFAARPRVPLVRHLELPARRLAAGGRLDLVPPQDAA